MTTSTVKRARTTEETEIPVEVSAVSRREFLYYIWGASMAMVLGASGGLILWFSYPRFRVGEFGGLFMLGPDDIPEKDGPPAANASGRFWLSHTDDGLAAFYQVCTHLGCLYKWVGTNNRFECPCHGSKFTLNGLYIDGPAPRGPDRFEISVTLADGTRLAPEDEYGMLQLTEDQIAQVVELEINTGSKVTGPAQSIEDL